MSDNYEIILRPSARRDLDSLDARTFQRILNQLKKLEENARPQDSKKLKGRRNEYRLRAGNYRILYEIVESDRTVRVFHVLTRQDAYKTR